MKGKLSPSPRLRGEGRGEGLFFEFGQQRLENPVQILNDIVIPDAHHAITEGCCRAARLRGVPNIDRRRVRQSNAARDKRSRRSTDQWAPGVQI